MNKFHTCIKTALALGLTGLLLALAGCGAEGTGPPCAADCVGCCDSAGNCMAASEGSCGINGSACQLCLTGQKCYNGACVKEPCSSSNCSTGCCQAGQCLPGNSVSACGQGGGVCYPCDSSENCQAGKCQKRPCGPGSCPAGCCAQVGCVAGTHPLACGSSGGGCKTCKANEKCQNQKCVAEVCSPSTCATGCCETNGKCQQGNTEFACGSGGQGCTKCQPDESCSGGQCKKTNIQCNATNCATGCCDSKGQCVPGNAGAACGQAGSPCAVCGSSQECVGNKCACTATACKGCCEGDKCQSGHLEATCGLNGAKCAKCKSGESCVKGACSTACGAKSCPAGCCDVGGVCRAGTDVGNCGASGNKCTQCNASAGEVCTKGTCNNVLSCNATSCNKGCCASSQCKFGNTNQECGSGGKVCEICKSYQSCQSNTCKLKGTANWSVTLIDVQVDATKDYDPNTIISNPAPDIYVQLTVGTTTKKSKTVDNTAHPVYNEFLLNGTTLQLLGAIKIKVWDFDPYDPDDPLADCTDTFYEYEVEKGKATISYCGSSYTNFKSIQFAFSHKP